MDPNNPYAPPQAEVSDPDTAVAGELRASPRSNPAGHGGRWLSAGFALFKAAPWIWIVTIILMFLVLFALLLVPFAGSLGQSLLSPVFTGGLMLGAHALDRGQPLSIGHLFAGFQQRVGALIGLGAVTLVGSTLIFVGAFAASGLGMDILMTLESGALTPEQLASLGPTIAIAVLIAMAILLPLFMAVWFAPALLVLHEELGLFQAMKLSFVGCLKNILPFLIYGLIGLLLSIVATIPLALGWLVLVPTIFGSIYAGYKDIFLA